MHAKPSHLVAAILSMGVCVLAVAQGRVESPFAASAPNGATKPSVVGAPAALPASAASSAALAVPTSQGTAVQPTSSVGKPAGPLLAGAPTIAQLSSLQQAALQADARKKAAELYASPDAASAPAPAVVRRVDPFGGAAPKAAPLTMRVAAIVGRRGAESVEIRDASGRVAVYTAGMSVGGWQVMEVRSDAIVLRSSDATAKREPSRQKVRTKPVKASGPTSRLVPLGGEFPSSAT